MPSSQAIKGVIRGGRVELLERVDAADGTEVVVNVPVDSDRKSKGRTMTFGMFAGGRGTTETDFQETKQLWEREWERSWNRLERT